METMSAAMSLTMLQADASGPATTPGASLEIADGGAFADTLGAVMVAAAVTPRIAPPPGAELVLVLDGEWTREESTELDPDQPVPDDEVALLDRDQAVTLERGLALWAARVAGEPRDSSRPEPPAKPRTIERGPADGGEVEVPDYGGTLPPEGRMEANHPGAKLEAAEPNLAPNLDRVGEAAPAPAPGSASVIEEVGGRAPLMGLELPPDRAEPPRAAPDRERATGLARAASGDRPAADWTTVPEFPAAERPTSPQREPTPTGPSGSAPVRVGNPGRRDQVDDRPDDRRPEQMPPILPSPSQPSGLDREVPGPGGGPPPPDRSPSSTPSHEPDRPHLTSWRTAPPVPPTDSVDRGHRAFVPADPSHPEARPAAYRDGAPRPWIGGTDRMPVADWAVDETVPATALIDRAGAAPIEIAGFAFPTLGPDDPGEALVPTPPPHRERNLIRQGESGESLTDRDFAVLGRPNVDLPRKLAGPPPSDRPERPVASREMPIVDDVAADRDQPSAGSATAWRAIGFDSHERGPVPTDPAPAPTLGRPAPAESIRPAPVLAPPTPTIRRDQVTIQFADEGGEVGRIRVAVNGPTVRATIIPHDPALAERLTGNLRELRRSLEERGFSEPRVTVQAPRSAEPPVGILAGREIADYTGILEFRDPTRGANEDPRRDSPRDPWREGTPNGRDQRQRPPGRQKHPPQEERRPER